MRLHIVALAVLLAFVPALDAGAQQKKGTASRPAAAGKSAKPGAAKPGEAAKQKPPAIPPREDYTGAEASAAAIAGMPEARFWGDSEADFQRALPTAPGPWLALSSGGADGAFGAGLLLGWTETGKRPDFALVTGVSTGALMAPFVFAGPKYDPMLRTAYTTINAGDVFEVRTKPDSFFDTWPLQELIAKQVTPQLLTDVAAEHAKGRRLFVVTTNLDSERPTVWNMGAIAAVGGEAGLKLFRQIMLAAGSIPGAFPPVLIEVEASGKRFQEMHADGGMCAQFFIAPESLLASTSNYRLPATELYVVINTQLTPDFQVTERSLVPIVVRGVSVIVKTLTRVMIQQAYLAAKRSDIPFDLATIPSSFNEPSRGAFDTEYMKLLFNVGFDQGKLGTAFTHEPPAFSNRLNPVPR